MESLYDILQISKDASKSEVKKAYFSLVKVHSPERDPERFKSIRHAYDTLMNDEKRKEYDKVFDVPQEFAGDFLKAKGYIDDADYKAAITLLERLNEEYPKEFKIMYALGNAYEMAGNTTKAVKVFEALSKDYPDDPEVTLGLTLAYRSRGFNKKAKLEYERFLDRNPENAQVWKKYVSFSSKDFKINLLELIKKAENIKSNMFAGEYHIYTYAILTSIRKNDINTAIEYFEKYVDSYIVDEKIDIDTFEEILSLAAHLSVGESFESCMIKLLPYLENCKFKSDDHIKDIEKIKTNLKQASFFSDKTIENAFKGLTERDLKKFDDHESMLEKFMFELEIVMHIDSLRKSLIHIKNNYPEIFKLNEHFYNEVLLKNNKNILVDKYMKKYLNLRKKNPDFFPSDEYDELFNDMSDLDEVSDVFEAPVPFVRNEPKIGRNKPCPCGSGKKYKNCCGK